MTTPELIPPAELRRLGEHAVWHANAAIERDADELADEISRTYALALIGLLTEAAS